MKRGNALILLRVKHCNHCKQSNPWYCFTIIVSTFLSNGLFFTYEKCLREGQCAIEKNSILIFFNWAALYLDFYAAIFAIVSILRNLFGSKTTVSCGIFVFVNRNMRVLCFLLMIGKLIINVYRMPYLC